MNVFILNTGRCGSSTFINACRHIDNYSSGHESRSTFTGQRRLAYPENHIEADNRLSWLLGRLHNTYGKRALYVHLSRDAQDTADSFVKRTGFGIMKAYREGILMGGPPEQSSLEVALDYIETVEMNIKLFLHDKPNTMNFRLENAASDFQTFWNRIGATGNLDRALGAWSVRHNASE
jgi:hypothetical protein